MIAFSSDRFPRGSLVDWEGELVEIRYEVSAPPGRIFLYDINSHVMAVKYL